MIWSEKKFPILIKLQKDFKDNPSSFAYAPLAQCYRKLALYQKAYDVLSVGLHHHRDHCLGHLVLAQCYFDEVKFDLCYQTLEPWVEFHRNNVQMQEIYAKVCIKKGLVEEALECYKYLLFLFPKNIQYQQAVKKWEDSFYRQENKVLDFPTIELPFEDSNSSAWVESVTTIGDISCDPETISTPPPAPQDSRVNLNLVDLYLKENLEYKALALLYKMLELNPDEMLLKNKKIEITHQIMENSFLLFNQKIKQRVILKENSLAA